MEERKLVEKEFHDALRTGEYGQRWSLEQEKVYQSNPMWVNMKYYAIEKRSRGIVEQWFEDNVKNRVVLDYCCGNGEDTLFIAKKGAAKVVGIDLSDVSIANCTERAASENLSCVAEFRVMDAEALEFENDTFDIVSEYGALHHMDLDRAFESVRKVLKPEGRVICVETLGHNPLIHLYRKSTMHLRTQWEVDHILKRKDIEKAYKYFNKIDYVGFFYLAALAAVPFRNTPFFFPLLYVLERVDHLLFKVPFLKWNAWQVVFVLSEPKK